MSSSCGGTAAAAAVAAVLRRGGRTLLASSETQCALPAAAAAVEPDCSEALRRVETMPANALDDQWCTRAEHRWRRLSESLSAISLDDRRARSVVRVSCREGLLLLKLDIAWLIAVLALRRGPSGRGVPVMCWRRGGL